MLDTYDGKRYLCSCKDKGDIIHVIVRQQNNYFSWNIRCRTKQNSNLCKIKCNPLVVYQYVWQISINWIGYSLKRISSNFWESCYLKYHGFFVSTPKVFIILSKSMTRKLRRIFVIVIDYRLYSDWPWMDIWVCIIMRMCHCIM